MRKLAELASEENLSALNRARCALAEQWPVLAARSPDPEIQELADALRDLLVSESALEQLDKILEVSERIATEYAVLYRSLFAQREKAYGAAIEQIKGLTEWAAVCDDPEVTAEQRDAIIKPLASRLSGLPEPNILFGAVVCRDTSATIAQMESDLAAVEGLSRQVIRRLQEFVDPEETVERFRVAGTFSGKITSKDDLEAIISAFREKVSKLLAQGRIVILE